MEFSSHWCSKGSASEILQQQSGATAWCSHPDIPIPIQECGCLCGARAGGVFHSEKPHLTLAHSDLLHTGRHLPKVAVCQEAEGAASSVTFYDLQAMLSHPTASFD